MLKGKLVQTTASDGFILHGILAEPNDVGSKLVLHLHGSYGNFYENFFIKDIATALTGAGVYFLSANTRGHDYYSDLKREKPGEYESVRIGGIREVFQECSRDIEGWLTFAGSLGVSEVILEGHSLGAMKVVYHVARHPVSNGLVLISPPDNFGIQYAHWGARFKDDLQLATKLVTDNKGDELMPVEAYYDPISARAFLSLLGTPEDTGMFTYSDVELMRRSGLAALRCPVLATFAAKGEAVVDPLENCIGALREAISRPELLKVEIIDGANHSYHFRGGQLAAVISTWVSGL